MPVPGVHHGLFMSNNKLQTFIINIYKIHSDESNLKVPKLTKIPFENERSFVISIIKTAERD